MQAKALGLTASAGSNGYPSPSSSKPFNRGEPKPKRFKLDFRSRRVLAEPVTEDIAAELQSHFEVSPLFLLCLGTLLAECIGSLER